MAFRQCSSLHTFVQHALKLPHSINFNKKNPIHPFDVDPSRGLQSLEFFSNKNDASLFVVGMHSKKRPNDLVWVRCFDGQVLDMVEMGLEKAVPMSAFKVGLCRLPVSSVTDFFRRRRK